ETAPLRDVVVDLVGGDDPSAAPPRHRGSTFEHPLVLWPPVMVQLAEDVLFAQGALQLAHSLFAVGRAEIEELAAMLGHGVQGRARLALGLVGVGEGRSEERRVGKECRCGWSAAQ